MVTFVQPLATALCRSKLENGWQPSRKKTVWSGQVSSSNARMQMAIQDQKPWGMGAGGGWREGSQKLEGWPQVTEETWQHNTMDRRIYIYI